MEMRFVYARERFFGGMEQVEETCEASVEKIKKAFRFMKAHPTTTAVWFHFDGYALGYWFENETYANDRLLTVRTQSQNETQDGTIKLREAKKFLIETIEKERG